MTGASSTPISLVYYDYGKTAPEVNKAFRTLLRNRDPEAWSKLLSRFAERGAFADANPAGKENALHFLAQYNGHVIVHGHTAITRMTGQRYEDVTAPLIYAGGLCTNVDGGIHRGGPGFVYRLPSLTGHRMKPTLEIVRAYSLLTIGAAMLALANDIFLIPNQVFSGGATGVALVINSFLGIPVGVVVLLVNIPLLAAGLFWLGGWRFLVRTTYTVILYSLLLDILRPFFEKSITTDPLLYTLYGGLLGGAGVGLVFRAQGTTGGDDIVAQLLFRFRGIPVNSALVIINAAILALVGVRFGPEKALYALISAFASSTAVNAVLEGFRPTRLVYIISAAPDQIATRIQTTTGRGVTYLSGAGAYTGRDYRVIMTAVQLQELPIITNIVREVDPAAFVIVSEAREVMGYGFKPLPAPPASPQLRLPGPLRVVRRIRRKPRP